MLRPPSQASLLEIVRGIEADLDQFVDDVPYADDRTVLLVRRSSAG